MVVQQPSTQAAAPVKSTDEDIAYHAKRVKITGWTMKILGIVSLISCVHATFTARQKAEKLLWGAEHPDEKPQHGGWWHHHQHMDDDDDKPVTRMELFLYDTIRTLGMLGFIWSMTLICMGKGAIWVARCQKPWFAKRVFKKSIFGLVVFCALMHFMSSKCKVMHHKLEAIRDAHRNTTNTTAQDIADGRQLQTMVIEVPNVEEIQRQFEQAELAMEQEMEREMIMSQQIPQQKVEDVQEMKVVPTEVKTAPKEKKVEEESPRLMAYRMFANKYYDQAKEEEGEVEKEIAKREARKKAHHHGHGKKFHGKKGRGCCVISFLFWATAWGYHFYHLYKLKVAVVKKKRESNNGEESNNQNRPGHCHGPRPMKNVFKVVQGLVGQQQVQPATQQTVAAPATKPNYDYTISEPAYTDEETAQTNLVAPQTNSIN